MTYRAVPDETGNALIPVALFEVVKIREPWAICSECGAWLTKEQCGTNGTGTCCEECQHDRRLRWQAEHRQRYRVVR